jgi:phosphate transport system permease protein
VSRIAGETAPLLLTTLTSLYLVTDPRQPVATLPALVYDYGKSAYPKLQSQAWGAALVLITAVLLVNVTVRLLSMRRRRLT